MGTDEDDPIDAESIVGRHRPAAGQECSVRQARSRKPRAWRGWVAWLAVLPLAACEAGVATPRHDADVASRRDAGAAAPVRARSSAAVDAGVAAVSWPDPPETDARCGSLPSDWCPTPPGDPCGAHRDVKACEADAQCGGIRYIGESLLTCEFDRRGFGTNCPTVGCVALAPPVEAIAAVGASQARSVHVVEGFVTHRYVCPPCPPGDDCKACTDDFVVLSAARRGREELYPLRGDDLVVFAHIANKLIVGSRYRLWVRVRPAIASGRSVADADLLLEQRRP